MKQKFEFQVWVTIDQLRHLNKCLTYIPVGLEVEMMHFWSASEPGYYRVIWMSYDSANIAAIVGAFTFAWRRNYIRKDGN